MNSDDNHDTFISPVKERQPPAKRTRRRKLLSCHDCRRRKLQCDRGFPACGRCTKAGQASGCLYLVNAADLPSTRMTQSPPKKTSSRKIASPVEQTGRDAITRLHYQESRIRELEHALADSTSTSTTISATTYNPITPVSISDDPTQATLRGTSFQTQLQGQTYTASILTSPGIRKFNNEIHAHFSALSRMRRELRDEETETRVPRDRVDCRVVTDGDLRLLLAPKMETDELVHLYLDHYGKMFHVLYMPAFWEGYAGLWRSDVESSDVGIVAVVLAMMACVVCLKPLTVSLFEARLRADAIIEALDAWIVQQDERGSVVTGLQLRVLVAVAKQASGRRFKKNWLELGHILQLCMAEGLHRESEGLPPIEKELRRRIWAAVVELELQASFDRGMPSTIPAFDSLPPTNIHDRDLGEEPTSPTNDFTRITCLATAASSLPIRLEISNRLNSTNNTLTLQTTKQYTDILHHHLDLVLDFSKSAHDPSNIIPESILILQLTLRQYILILNEAFLPHAQTKSEGDFSRMVILQQATEILHLYNSLARPTCRLGLELFQSYHVRAAIAVCQVASGVCGAGPGRDIAFASWADAAVGQIVSVVKAGLKEKVVHIGREQRHLWCVLVAEAYLRSQVDPSRRLIYMQKAVEEMAEAYSGMLAARAEVIVNNQLLQLPEEWEFDPGIFDEPVDFLYPAT